MLLDVCTAAASESRFARRIEFPLLSLLIAIPFPIFISSSFSRLLLSWFSSLFHPFSKPYTLTVQTTSKRRRRPYTPSSHRPFAIRSLDVLGHPAGQRLNRFASNHFPYEPSQHISSTPRYLHLPCLRKGTSIYWSGEFGTFGTDSRGQNRGIGFEYCSALGLRLPLSTTITYRVSQPRHNPGQS